MSIGGNRRVAFFLKEKNNAIGGMETHANQFVKYFDRINMLRFIVYDHFIYEITATGMKEVQYEDIDFLIGYLYKNKIDTLFFNNGQWIEYFSVFRKYFPDAKLIMRSGGNEFMKAPIDDMSISLVKRRRIWAECINQLDFIIANSAFTLHRMQAIGIKREKIILVRGGVDVNFCNDNYVSRLKNKKEFCEKYNIKDGNILLGIISRFEEFKGIEQTLNVLKNYKEQKWHLIVAGEGKLRLEIKTFLKNNFDDCRYTFLGKLNNDESIKVISILDYLLNLSVVFKRKSGNELYEHTETMGRSMLEAICCNVPIISTDVGGAAEWFVENVKIGYLVKDVNEFDKRFPEIINNHFDIILTDKKKYDWSYIFEKIYIPLMKLEKDNRKNINLVVDIEGTIIHDFFSEKENEDNFKRILELSNICNVVINTAGELDNIFSNYPYVYDYLDKIIIIANCGKKILIYGNKCDIWSNYEESLFGPSERVIGFVKKEIERKGYKISRVNQVDKLYVNYKVETTSEEVIQDINRLLSNTLYEVYRNKSNIKLISEEINKGNTMTFINNILGAEYSIGIGNGVLDELFLKRCNKAYLVNYGSHNIGIETVSIECLHDMNCFIEEIINEIKKKENTGCVC